MEGEKKQRKVHVLKKVQNIPRAWCSIQHAEQTVLWNSEANSGVVPHQTDIVDNLYVFEPLLPSTSWTLLASLSLSSSVSYNLTSIHLCFSSSLFPSFPYWPFCFCLLCVYGHPHLFSGIDRTVLTSFPTHLCPHISCIPWLPLCLCWCPPLPALTQWGFLCNSVLVSVWISVILVWYAKMHHLELSLQTRKHGKWC